VLAWGDVDRGQSGLDGLHPVGLLVEERVFPFGCIVVVVVEGVREVANRQTDLRSELLNIVRGGRDFAAEHVGLLPVLLADDQIDLFAGFELADITHSDSCVVDILVEKALPLAVDQNAEGVTRRRVERDRDEALIHVERRGSGPLTHSDAGAIIKGIADRMGALRNFRAVVLPHVLVHGEATGTKDDALAGTDISFLIIDSNDEAVNRPVFIGYEA